MNWQLCDFFEQGGHMMLDSDQELALLRVRHKLVAVHVPFAYETRDEYHTRKRGKGAPWEPRLRLWRGLTAEEMKVIGC